MKKKTPAKSATKKIRIPLPDGKTMVLEASRTRLLKASIGRRSLDFTGPVKLGDLKATLNGKEITNISADSTIVTKSLTQTCTWKIIGGRLYFICDPPFPPC